jgi:hypothetical protein
MTQHSSKVSDCRHRHFSFERALRLRCTGRTIKLTGVEFEVRSNDRNFAVLTLNAVEGQPVPQSRRLLLAAAGDVENTGMGWNAEHTTVGTGWGSAPTICEGVAGRITLAAAPGSAKVYALDGTGARAPSGIAVGDKTTSRQGLVRLDPARRSLAEKG